MAGVIEEGLQVGEVSETESSYTLFGTVDNEVCPIGQRYGEGQQRRERELRLGLNGPACK